MARSDDTQGAKTILQSRDRLTGSPWSVDIALPQAGRMIRQSSAEGSLMIRVIDARRGGDGSGSVHGSPAPQEINCSSL